MNIEKEKKCNNCNNLKLEENNCPVSNNMYSCSIINNIIYSTRLLVFKLEFLDKFYCNFYKKKN